MLTEWSTTPREPGGLRLKGSGYQETHCQPTANAADKKEEKVV